MKRYYRWNASNTMPDIGCNSLKRNIFDSTNKMPPILCKEYYAIFWQEIPAVLPMKCHQYYARNILHFFDKKYLQYYQGSANNKNEIP